MTLMKLVPRFSLLVLLVIGLCAFGLNGAEEVPVDRSMLLKIVNAARQKGCKCGNSFYKPVPPISWNETLEKAAVAHSSDMKAKNYFSHISPGGFNPGDRIQRQGYRWKAYGENIGLGYRTEQEVISAWLSSPGHCQNIMNKDFTEMAVGRSGEYWTQTFGSR